MLRTQKRYGLLPSLLVMSAVDFSSRRCQEMSTDGGSVCFSCSRTLVDGMVQVSEKDIGLSVLRLVEHEKLVQVSLRGSFPSPNYSAAIWPEGSFSLTNVSSFARLVGVPISRSRGRLMNIIAARQNFL
jgi:hypothetical protein